MFVGLIEHYKAPLCSQVVYLSLWPIDGPSGSSRFLRCKI